LLEQSNLFSWEDRSKHRELGKQTFSVPCPSLDSETQTKYTYIHKNIVNRIFYETYFYCRALAFSIFFFVVFAWNLKVYEYMSYEDMSFLLSNLIICWHIIYQMQNEFILMHFLVVGIFFGRKIENYSKASKVIILFKPIVWYEN
jgi:hypothetical protein